MRAMFITPLEQAIIETLRRECKSIRCIVLNTLNLPYPAEEYSYVIELFSDRGIDAERVQEEQAEKMKRYKLKGYGSDTGFMTAAKD